MVSRFFDLPTCYANSSIIKYVKTWLILADFYPF
nr:MAG TPA: hypothetical protein [Caudoviricetes sp.]